MQFAVLSDIGKKRTLNEDSAAVFTLDEHAILAVIADGMGGHQGGDFASSTALRLVGEAFEKVKKSPFEQHSDWMEWLKETALYVNRTLYNYASKHQELEGMGTTMELVLIFDRTCFGVHIGDSRVYAIQDRTISQVTSDHSYVNVLVNSGEITEQEAKVHPQRNWIIKAVGSERFLEPDCYQFPIDDEVYILICSDGLSNKLTNNEIKNIVVSNLSLKEKTTSLVEMANKKGGEDNISVILVHAPQQEVE